MVCVFIRLLVTCKLMQLYLNTWYNFCFMVNVLHYYSVTFIALGTFSVQKPCNCPESSAARLWSWKNQLLESQLCRLLAV